MKINLSNLSKVSNQISLSKKVVGIDIDDRSIEVVMLEKKDGRPKVKSLSRIVLDYGIVENGRIKNEKKLSKLLIKALIRARPIPINKKDDHYQGLEFAFGLSDSQVYSQTFTFKSSSDTSKTLNQETLTKIDKKVKTNIPLDTSDLLYSYKNIKKNEGKISVLVVGTSKKVAKEWYTFFLNNGIKLKYFDSESMAIIRGLLIREQKLPVCIVDMGASSTLISIFDKSGLFYSYSLNQAGDTLTKEIVKREKIRHNQAESYKKKYGLAYPDKKAFPIMIKVLEPIVKEIKVALDFHKTHSTKEISGIILVGGTSKLRGLKDYLSANLEKKIWFGNSKLVKEKSPLEYIEAIGLAIGGLDNKHSDLFLRYVTEVKQGKIDLKNFNFKKDGKKIYANIINKFKNKSKTSVSTSENKSPLSQKKLITVFALAILFLVSAFWYREDERQKRVEEIKTKVTQFAQTQQLRIEVPIAINPSAYKEDRVRGRVVVDAVKLASGFNEAKVISQERVASSLIDDEIIWENPLNAINKSNIIFPLEMEWLVYSDNEAREMVVASIDKLNAKKTDYILSEMSNVNIAYSDNPGVMVLISRVTLSLHEPFEKAVYELSPGDFEEVVEDVISEQASQEIITESQEEDHLEANEIEVVDVVEEEAPVAPEIKIIEVRILDTEVGWLNVRSTPLVGNNLVGRINPGETYPLLEDANSWYKIKISDSQEGWISSRYAQIIQ